MIYRLFQKAENDLNFDYLDLFESDIYVAKIDENNYSQNLEEMNQESDWILLTSKDIFNFIEYVAQNPEFSIDFINNEKMPEELELLLEKQDYKKLKEYIENNQLLIDQLAIYINNCQLRLSKNGNIKVNKENCLQERNIIDMFKYALGV